VTGKKQVEACSQKPGDIFLYIDNEIDLNFKATKARIQMDMGFRVFFWGELMHAYY
jgi:hypothetical protein